MRSLQKCGEDVELLPLFKAAFPSLTDVHENKYTVRLDGRARDILLTGVITRIIRYTSEHVRLVFICDDVQCEYTPSSLDEAWHILISIRYTGADQASIRVLQQVHEQCQRVMLIMATRPIRDYNVTFLKDFCASGSHQEITLNGLGADEIGEIILQTLQTTVKRVGPEIVRVIQVIHLKIIIKENVAKALHQGTNWW